MRVARSKSLKIRPLLALDAIIRFMFDCQDTRQVARITVALRGSSEANLYVRFKKSPVGKKVLANRLCLGALLHDHLYLAACPENSLGRHMLDYINQNDFAPGDLEHSLQGITDDLVKGGVKIKIFAERMRDLHDIYHVLAGFERDEFGELCVLAFAYPQQKLRSFAVIAVIIALNFGIRLIFRGIWPGQIYAALRAAFAAGANAAWLPGEDIEAMLAEDIAILRQRLNIPEPAQYRHLLATLRRKSSWQSGPFFSRPNPAGGTA
jgi:ubiquinone biosynthesis protein COQ4